MVFKTAASLLLRLSRTFISHPLKTRIFQIPKIPKTHEIHSKYPTRFYLFPSIYRSFITPLNGQNVIPSRIVLNEIKRRLFFAAPSSSRVLLGLLGYSLFQQSSPIDRFQLDKTFNQIGNLLSKTTIMDQFDEENEKHSRASLDDYELGRLLGCGCNAAVYEARLRSPSNFTIPSERHSSESDIEILSRQSSYEDIREEFDNDEVPYSTPTNIPQTSDVVPAGQFNLAIKMLYNYGIQSNAEALKKAMDKELIPLNQSIDHPNVIRMYSCFVDTFPLLNEAHEFYPMAIPTCLSSDSFGRNKTLFIVMRKYDLTLNEYIQKNQPTKHERLILFAQLLEALLYLNNHSIVHRDLKSDNLLICNSTGELVLSDFGCALYHPPDLKIPYQTDEVCKGGNLALMAPEILTCKPGPKCFLDYNKSDLWASGSLFYEFFSQSNPFFHGQFQQDTYDDQNLPSLSSLTSPLLERLIHLILQKNPEKRPSILLVSNCIHLCLWFKSIKSKNELYQSYMWKALETLFNKHKLTRVEFNLKKLFFQRQTSQTFSRAQTFLNEL